MKRNTESGKLIANYLRNHIGLSLTTQDIADETGVLKNTVSGVIQRLELRGWEIKHPFGRGSYLFTGKMENEEKESSVVKTPQIMEVLGQTKKGDLLVRAEDGSLWKASEVIDL